MALIRPRLLMATDRSSGITALAASAMARTTINGIRRFAAIAARAVLSISTAMAPVALYNAAFPAELDNIDGLLVSGPVLTVKWEDRH